MWGLWGLGVISIVDIIERIAQKLRIIILLHFGLGTFRIHFGKTQQVIMFMVFGLSGRVYDSQNQFIHLWRHQDTSNHAIQNLNRFWK